MRVGTEQDAMESSANPRVVIVGGGVSGCACAATLASGGVAVLVMNSALDTVGQPSLGPELGAGGEGPAAVFEALRKLPSQLRDAWMAAATVSDEAWGGVVVDRRMLSVETKRALETIPGLKFRQGLVTGIRVAGSEDGGSCSMGSADLGTAQTQPADTGSRRSPLVVETAFGEAIEADIVVVAVGLALGGEVRAGEHVLPGGRYGETASPGLREALDRLGAEWRRSRVEVGPRLARGAGAAAWGAGADGDSVQVRRGRSAARGGEAGPGDWPVDYPPAPYWDESLRSRDFLWLASGARRGAGGNGEAGRPAHAGRPCLCPDGVATGEMYAFPDCELEDFAGGSATTRLALEISGLAVENLGAAGRLGGDRAGGSAVWVVGRAGGASDYLGSLLSGVRAGEQIAAVVRPRDETAGDGG